MLTLGVFGSKHMMRSKTFWQLLANVNGYASSSSLELVTQVAASRRFQILGEQHSKDLEVESNARIKVRLLEDGYCCWLVRSEIFAENLDNYSWTPKLFSSQEIETKLPAVMQWVEKASTRSNKYLWGGTLGPDFDCSGLVQAAFASEGIWIPRDSYQQESFCEDVAIRPDNFQKLRLCDLIFFGTQGRCNHVAIYDGHGFYWHSSGITLGRNGIGRDNLSISDKSTVASNYRSQLRGAARVIRCHDGTTLP